MRREIEDVRGEDKGGRGMGRVRGEGREGERKRIPRDPGCVHLRKATILALRLAKRERDRKPAEVHVVGMLKGKSLKATSSYRDQRDLVMHLWHPKQRKRMQTSSGNLQVKTSTGHKGVLYQDIQLYCM